MGRLLHLAGICSREFVRSGVLHAVSRMDLVSAQESIVVGQVNVGDGK